MGRSRRTHYGQFVQLAFVRCGGIRLTRDLYPPPPSRRTARSHVARFQAQRQPTAFNAALPMPGGRRNAFKSNRGDVPHHSTENHHERTHPRRRQRQTPICRAPDASHALLPDIASKPMPVDHSPLWRCPGGRHGDAGQSPNCSPGGCQNRPHRRCNRPYVGTLRRQAPNLRPRLMPDDTDRVVTWLAGCPVIPSLACG
jgi:hypothetical protein